LAERSGESGMTHTGLWARTVARQNYVLIENAPLGWRAGGSVIHPN
jgi:hypothetical protein